MCNVLKGIIGNILVNYFKFEPVVQEMLFKEFFLILSLAPS